ncbi:cytospin-A isoform X1 [Oryzias latipes]|uniref:cytospin-A isoform X1 n=1 Tax=Oryzias latipes TaxID=8090 RepID=UPI000CE1B3FE|nr:cytospin-A isoform X1 [Oryzias latipes]XP_023809043.1 cytospin-A isoform X1 [Oryzias latipes]XP_023809044.1 cytospin-A isoform X1 [Oryzias latipes]
MGNHNSNGPHDPAGSPSDFFHTPPNSPSEAFLAAMALPSAASTDKPQTEKPSPNAERTQRMMASSDWSIISTGSVSSTDTKVSDAVAAEETPVVSLESSTALCEGFPSELSWQERDSGMEPQGAAERAREDLTLALLGVMEHYKANLRVAPNMDIAVRAEELIRRLITEKEELVEEVDTLRETLKTERSEWHQFQCDLQIAVSVADRLRLEMEEELSFLKRSHRAVEQQLAQALSRQQETERELESLRAENKEICRRLSEFMAQQQQERAELEVLRNICRRNEEKQDHQEDEKKKVTEDFEDKVEDEEEKNQEDGDEGGCDAQKTNGSENLELTGKGVAEGYIRSLAALEKKKEEQRVPRRIVMSERSWSLTRLPLQSNSQENGASKNLSSTLPLCKKEEPTKERRGDRLLQRQDSWSSFSTGQRVNNHSSDSIKPQDNFSALLRRHGGSRRNSLLRWSQSQTQGYKNIEITNFSSSWEDGLAFCALYHTYLPADIPYDSLNPAEKKENLELAFRTGANAGISATLTAEEMLKEGGPDWQKVLGYVERIFRHFEM